VGYEVKLLIDQSLSHRLGDRLAELGIIAVHVRSLGLEGADDARVWDHAAKHEFMIVSKDGDFNNRAFLFGPPPKVVWIQRGSCSTRDIEALLRARHADLVTFAADAAAALLILE
jgi:predicted nuclease of predicted toxin-antitoxin system